MKKILLLIFVMTLLTGCTANYTLNINNESFKETIKFDVKKSQIKNTHDADNILYLEQNDIPVFKDDLSKFYKKDITSANDRLQSQLYYEYHGKEFENSRIFQECFSNNIFIETSNSYYIKLYGDFNCNFIENYNLSINIITDNKVLKNNADNVYKNKYTWNLNKSNDTNKEIEIQVSKKIDTLKENGSFLYMSIIVTVLFIFTILTVIVIFKKVIIGNK